MINLSSRKAKRAYVKEFDRQMQLLEIPFTKKVRPLLNRQYLDSARLVDQGIVDINSTVDKSTDRFIRLLYNHYKKVAIIFGNKVFNIIESSKSVNIPEIKSPKDEFWRAINLYITSQAGEKIQKINKATRNNITTVIQKGMNEGISHRDIAKNIRKNGLITSRSRAVMISRTETHSVAVRAVDESVRSTRIEMEREWVSSKDGRTRTRSGKSTFEHFASFPVGPDGERVSQDGWFKGTGEAIKHPGDPNGSAANTVNCR